MKNITLTIGGVEYKATSNMSVAWHFEEVTGKNYFDVFGPAAAPSARDVLCLVWASIKAADKSLKLTPLELAEKLDNEEAVKVSAQIMKLMSDNSPKAGEHEEGEAAPLETKPQA